jgi:type II restriction/modification system DNA methylase subunit YeeA
MNTSVLKAFAPAVRRALQDAVSRKLDVVLAAQSPDYRTTFAPQVAVLRAQAAADRDELIERVSYTWFNRIAALRYLDARGWHPFNARVLTPSDPSITQPELLKQVREGALPEALRRFTDPARLDGLLDGQIPSTAPQAEVYRHLVLAACRYYHALLPNLFERLDDATELLLPDDLLTDQSVIAGFRSEITDDDCADVEVLGWLYQFYISEKKDEVMARKSAVPTEDIPAVTQLFTPHWIVRYLVENSLGRLWLLNRPKSRLRKQMPYYIEEEAETDFLRITKPEEIRLCDPAAGSGHMLTYAFDLLYAIYEEEGYAPTEIPALILRHNLYGIDIDARAAQLAELALVFKAREKSRRFSQAEQLVRPQIIELQEVRFTDAELREYIRALDLGALFNAPLLALLHQFEEVKTFGSLIRPCLDERAIADVRRAVEAKDLGGQLFLSETHLKVLRVLEQAEALSERYHVVVANPPYMGAKQMTDALKTFASEHYVSSKADLFAMFIERAFTLAVRRGNVAMITMQSWMFLSGYEELREKLILKKKIVSMAHLGARAFDTIGGAVVQSVAFIMANEPARAERSVFIRLVNGESEAEKSEMYLQALNDPNCEWLFRASASGFQAIPGSPIAYWLSTSLTSTFSLGLLKAFTESGGRCKTHNDRKYVRYVWEIDSSSISPYGRWKMLAHGGESRRWYGNRDRVFQWSNEARDVYDSHGGLSDPKVWNRTGVCWSGISSNTNSFRIKPSDSENSSGSPTLFCDDTDRTYALLGYLNSVVSANLLAVINPTINANVGDIQRLPWVDVESATSVAQEAVSLACADWDNLETSLDFRDSPLLRRGLKSSSLKESFSRWESNCAKAIHRMQELEQENNQLFINAYGLDGELQPEVPEVQITLARADARRDVAAFLSYAVGCMMGRYSPDHPGLILANAGDTLCEYLDKVGKPQAELTFAPDEDGIIPVLDGEWFEDDIVARTRDFLRATFGDATLRENLRFIEESLGKELRKYFLTDFYKDHLQTYKKRPIYWIVQSPKKGFSVLVYLHRYNRDTLNVVLNRYLREYQGKLRSRLAQLSHSLAGDDLSARDRTGARKELDRLTKVLHECEEWERQTLLPLAQQRIALDLDDGVKVNYLKFGGVLAPIPGLAAADD